MRFKASLLFSSPSHTHIPSSSGELFNKNKNLTSAQRQGHPTEHECCWVALVPPIVPSIAPSVAPSIVPSVAPELEPSVQQMSRALRAIVTVWERGTMVQMAMHPRTHHDPERDWLGTCSSRPMHSAGVGVDIVATETGMCTQRNETVSHSVDVPLVRARPYCRVPMQLVSVHSCPPL